MALKSYVVTQDFKSPYSRFTGHPKNPQEIRFKLFKKGEVVNGELKHANNQPAFVLVKGTLVLPLSHIKELLTKDVVDTSSSEGETKTSDAKKLIQPASTKKIKTMDAAIIGALVGLGAVYLANKQGWIAQQDKKHFIYGAVAGAGLGAYLVYRMKK